ncbi:MAG TPA: phosphatase PAP2 family protein [Acidimicrobiales bacterium]|nr:phosphatase PAP2 family protein [Acidimicrobiales bacterium]
MRVRRYWWRRPLRGTVTRWTGGGQGRTATSEAEVAGRGEMPAEGRVEVLAQGQVRDQLRGQVRGRRRRPSGEPPPLPHSVGRYAPAGAAVLAVAAGLSVAMHFHTVMAAVTTADDTVVRWLGEVRTPALTDLARGVDALGSSVAVRILAWSVIGGLVVFRRFRHLAVFLGVLLGCNLLGAALANSVGRMRPSGSPILAGWSGYSFPSRPVVSLTVVLVGAVHTLVPAGDWRRRANLLAAFVMAALVLSRVYLALDHPTDALTGAAIGWIIPVAAFLVAAPDEAFPISYRRGRKAHLDLGGRRGEAIIQALDHQLGLAAVAIEPFGLAGSAGSTPLRIHLGGEEGRAGQVLFGKLYALNHLRSDRWYKMARTVLYGRLEDEKPFNTVRRLTEYEDHMLRLFRDEGLPTPGPCGFVEITPEREYLVVMDFLDAAGEMDGARMEEATIRDGLAVVRRLWDSGIAHRDIKPSNLLVRDGRVLMIDVAFAAVRPTPWRQAVDLANMMMTLALGSSPETVYRLALCYFSADEIAEAFAASRSITIPSQLRSRLSSSPTDILSEFRRLAPPRSPVAIQLWDLRRLYVTLAVILGLAVAVAAVAVYLQTTSLL